jgi:hypothetical protein
VGAAAHLEIRDDGVAPWLPRPRTGSWQPALDCRGRPVQYEID